MNNYDVVVIGAGLSGLVSSVILLQDGYKVLLVDEHSSVGGVSKSIKCGRFEFEPSFHGLYFRDSDNDYSVRNLFKKLEIEKEISFKNVPDVFRVMTIQKDETNVRKDYIMPFGVDEFIDRMEQYVTGSKESITTFFEIAKECRNAFKYIAKCEKRIEVEHIRAKYPNFLRLSNNSVSKVLDELEVPLDAQEILNACWVYLGSPETEISFVHYASFLYDIVNYGICVPTLKTNDIIWTLFDKFLTLGGEVRFDTKVKRILIDSDKVKGIVLADDFVINTKNIISSVNEYEVYNNLIDDEKIKDRMLEILSKRHIGAREFNVYLGLNRSAKDLGIDNYVQLLYSSLDSDVEFNKMKLVNNASVVAVCPNVVDESMSVPGTCLLSLNTLYFDDCYTLAVDEDNIFNLKDFVANNLIDSFESATGINIREYIEEIRIVTPIDTARYNCSVDGSSYGYRYTGLDNLLPRMLNRNNEQYIKGLYFVSGFSGDVYGPASLYLIAETEVKRVKDELGGKNGRK